MKKIISIVMLALLSLTVTVNAEVIKEGKVYTQVSKTKSKTPGKDSGFTWKDSKGNIYPIMVGPSGSCYIIKVSKTSRKEYKQYLGSEVSSEICKELGIKYQPKNK